MAKIIVIGAHPKGYLYPFHRGTKSGKVLRKILNTHGIDATLLNLWKDQAEMDIGIISREKLSEISSHSGDGCRIVVVGRYMYGRLRKQIGPGTTLHYLPHPSARSKRYIETLELGLVKLSKE
jgi:hypothetical protein